MKGTLSIRPQTDVPSSQVLDHKFAYKENRAPRSTLSNETIKHNKTIKVNKGHDDSKSDWPQTAYTRQVSAHNIDFKAIRAECEHDASDKSATYGFDYFKQHRIDNWPHANPQGMGASLSAIYDACRQAGVPNAHGPKLPLPSGLNITAWESYLDSSPDDEELLKFIKYGFPLGYVGPVSDSIGTCNHPSATNYECEVTEFIQKEISLGGVIGPMAAPPFLQWAHISPLMSRAKKDSDQRRVIIDMTFPR